METVNRIATESQMERQMERRLAVGFEGMKPKPDDAPGMPIGNRRSVFADSTGVPPG